MKRSGTPIWAGTEFVKTLPFLANAPNVETFGASFFSIVENISDDLSGCDIKPLQTVVLSQFRLVQNYCGTGC
ncbi:hypothetical protein HBB04_03354 [Pseudomonas coronafaciens]|nr:hypothetical protein HBB04_03354 [Pseudomonas coronafaciens]